MAASKRRWFGVTALALLGLLTPLCVWLGYQMAWIRQRMDSLNDPNLSYATTIVPGHRKIFYLGQQRKLGTPVAPWPLNWLGERGYAQIRLQGQSPAERERIERLFPEADVF